MVSKTKWVQPGWRMFGILNRKAAFKICVRSPEKFSFYLPKIGQVEDHLFLSFDFHKQLCGRKRGYG